MYRALADQIEQRIINQRYRVGSQLPPEPELEREFHVSRTTIRQALGLLKRRGMLASRSGLGTVVMSNGADRTSMSVSGSVRDLVYYAAGTRYSAIDRKVAVPDAMVGAALDLAPAERVICFRGLRSRLQGVEAERPFAAEYIYIPESLGRDVDNEQLGTDTIFGRVERANNVTITDVEQTITAVGAPAVVARWLAIRPGVPMLKAVRVYRLAEGRAVEYATTYYDATRFEYAMRLSPD
jgi:GntR family transcriptional regulator